MKTKLAALLLVSFLNVGCVFSLKADHLAGGNITYSCAGGNIYSITVSIFRDCKGGPLVVPALIVSGCGNSDTIAYTGAAVTPIAVSTYCNATIKTTCDVPPGTYPGIQRYDYIFMDTLAAALAACTDVMFSYDACCRDSIISTLFNPAGTNMHLEAHLNAAVAPCNNSPVFPTQVSMYGKMFLCLNQTYCINYGVTEPDAGDSISYYWMTPRGANGSPVNYAGVGFDSAHSITGTQTLNYVNGDICMTPTMAGQLAVIAVKVTEWRKIGGVWNKIGWVERDIQLYMVACVNNAPTLSGINGTNLFSIQVCPGSKICFDIFTDDANAADSLIMTSGGVPPGTFTISATKHPTGYFCWQTHLSDSGKTFPIVVTVQDNGCPFPGTVTGHYSITVTGGTLYPIIYLSNDTLYCTYNPGSTYQWYFNGNMIGGNYPWIPLDSTGSYYVHVTDSNGCSGTSNTFSFTVGMSSLQNNRTVTIFPNPFNEHAKITLSNALQLTNVGFTLCDIYGRQVMNKKIETSEMEIDRGSISEGVYFYSVFNNEGVIAGGKILIIE